MNEEGPIQGVLDFESGNPNGFENWLREQEERLERIRREWSLPVGRNVRVRLCDIDGEFQGKLELVRYPESIDRRNPLQLRIGGVVIPSTEIEQCIVLD